jgi:hypothetical protein
MAFLAAFVRRVPPLNIHTFVAICNSVELCSTKAQQKLGEVVFNRKSSPNQLPQKLKQ